MIVAALSPLTDRKKDETSAAMMKRLTAIMAVFLFLGLVSAAGRGASKFAAGFGGLVTIALAVSNRDLFTKVGTLFAARTGKVAGREGGSPYDVDDQALIGDAIAGGAVGGAA